MTEPIFSGFLGNWILDTASCDYEQGDPPHADHHAITLDGGDLVISMDWTDATGETHHAAFRAPPDGRKIPFNGGPLADTLCLSAPSPSELNLSAFRDGLELMTATRRLDADGTALHLVQTVHLPDFSAPENRGTYLKADGPDT